MDTRRQHRTLSSVIDMFLTLLNLNGRELFSSALRAMDADENLEVVRNFLEELESMGHEEKGVSQQTLDSLVRVDVQLLPKLADCPICTNRFVDNEYPLVVELPCHVQGNTKKHHVFDMDCIAPWLKVNSTCPVCRFDVNDVARIRREKLQAEIGEEEEEEEWDMYG